MFIVIEGIDGSGKTTQSLHVAQWLESYTGHETIRTYEPGGWLGGETFREFILKGRKMCAKSELLLFLADRSEHVEQVILPALSKGINIVCERWNLSTLAYQTCTTELSFSQAERIISSCFFPVPDVNIFLDISPELAAERIKARGNNNDKYEAEGLELLRKVSDRYRLIADKNPGKFLRIKCDDMNEAEVFAAITSKLEKILWQSQ